MWESESYIIQQPHFLIILSQNIPDLEDKCDYLTDYLEATIPEINVCNLSFHSGIPDRVLIVLDEEIGERNFASEIENKVFNFPKNEKQVQSNSWKLITLPTLKKRGMYCTPFSPD